MGRRDLIEQTASLREAEEALTKALEKSEMSEADAEYFREAYSEAVARMMRMDDTGWLKYMSNTDIGPSIEEAKGIAKKIQDWTDSNALLWRGREIRCSYLFGAPYEIGVEDATAKVSPQIQNVFNHPLNQVAVFSSEALSIIEGARYTDGQAFVLYDRDAKRYARIPFEQISDLYYNPDNPAEVWYWKRTYDRRTVDGDGNVSNKEVKVWYPSDLYEPPRGGYLTKIDGAKVDTSKRMIDSRVNLKPGHTLGIPDAFSAAPWALAYSAYLRDGTAVLAALAEWAWKITPKKRDAAERAGAAVRNSSGNPGGTVITDAEMTALPKANAVDLGTGRPLASQVASALGISIVVLLSDPGQSGAYGTAQTLTDPTNRTMRTRQELNTEFLRRCLRVMGLKNPTVTWEKMSPADDKAEMEIALMLLGSGLFHADEIRPLLAKLGEVTLLHEKEPEGFILPNNMIAAAANAGATADATADAQPESTVKPDGTTSQTNGQGQDNQKIGNTSKTKANQNTTSKPPASKS